MATYAVRVGMSTRGCADPVCYPWWLPPGGKYEHERTPVTSQARVCSIWLRICLCLDDVCASPFARPLLGAVGLMMESAAAISEAGSEDECGDGAGSSTDVPGAARWVV